MFRISPLIIALPALLAPAFVHGAIDREIEERLSLRPGDRVEVHVTGAPIHLRVADQAEPRVRLSQQARTTDAAEAETAFAAHRLEVSREGDVVKVHVESPRRLFGRRNGLSQSLHLQLPAGVEVHLKTSGGTIQVAGRHTGRLVAETSGGGITLDETMGEAHLKTSGGSIQVNAVYGRLQAHTSGGSIRVTYVAPEANLVDVVSQGGSIALGVHPKGNWDLNAESTGGGVHLRDLPLRAGHSTRHLVSGQLNKGGSPLRAVTRGGSIAVGSYGVATADEA